MILALSASADRAFFFGVRSDSSHGVRALQPHRQQKRAAEVATVRFETAPGHQLQIDFGEKVVTVAGQRVSLSA
jgi:hypothetical protein